MIVYIKGEYQVVAEIREKQIMVNLEPTFYEMIIKLAEGESVTASTYTRSLLIKHLMSLGLLDTQRLTEVLMGALK